VPGLQAPGGVLRDRRREHLSELPARALTEELAARTDLAALPDSDLKHLSGDVDRAYGRLLCEWLAYMNHLRSDYPYLYSLAIPLNPREGEASPIVQQ
jgi:hypothetical protein